MADVDPSDQFAPSFVGMATLPSTGARGELPE